MAVMVASVFLVTYLTVLFLISERLDPPEFRLIALAVAVVGVVLLEPLRRRLRQRLEQRLVGDRSHPLRAMDRLPEQINQADAPTIYTGVVATVAVAMRSPGVVLTLQRDSGAEQVAAIGEATADLACIPLVYLGEQLGELQVAPRTEGEPFGRADRQ